MGPSNKMKNWIDQHFQNVYPSKTRSKKNMCKFYSIRNRQSENAENSQNQS